MPYSLVLDNCRIKWTASTSLIGICLQNSSLKIRFKWVFGSDRTLIHDAIVQKRPSEASESFTELIYAKKPLIIALAFTSENKFRLTAYGK